MDGKVRSNPFLAVIGEILGLQSCFEDLFAELSDATSLSTLQKLVIFAVFDAPAPPTVPQVGRNLGRPRQVIQRVVNELVREGFLAKAPNPHHKRAKLLVPTEQAVELKQRAERRAVEIADAFLGTVSAKRCRSLAEELRALRKAIDAYTQEQAPDRLSKSATGQPAKSTLALLERLN
ncbi:MAG: MarR family transcriptional regulator [Novosphingobium sp.]|nr:MarR family transcriptional regulator [Novosphingobium sp.]MCP5401901.1 MarR family transcriptional regulator [Novosphingobium sp.]